MMRGLHFRSRYVNKNENNFYIISCPGTLLKLDIMLRKANVLTYIWSFSENLENSRKLIL